MRKNVFGRKLKRDTNERKALFKGLMSALILYERIETTQAKAKAIQGQIEKLVTKTKKRKNGIKDSLQKYIAPPAMDKFITDIAPRFTNRNGGYTRIIKTGHRIKEKAAMAIIEWVEKPIQNSESKIKSLEKKDKKPVKKKTAKVEVQVKEIKTKKESKKKEKTK